MSLKLILLLLLLVVVSLGTSLNSSLSNDNSHVNRLLTKSVSKNTNSSFKNGRHQLAHMKRVFRRKLEHLSREKKLWLMEHERKLKAAKIEKFKRSDYLNRDRRAADPWIKKSFEGESTKSYALIVRDEEMPPCPESAPKITNTRYFMCSGVIIGPKHVLTVASCIHYAHIYEHHLEADLGVLIGVDAEISYVLKIEKFEMHPNYAYDIEAENHATHNIAMIFLSCEIPQHQLIIPKLPVNINDDIGHRCCPDRCDVITVSSNDNNRHEMLLLKARNLPPPYHDDDSKQQEQQSTSSALSHYGSEYLRDSTPRYFRRLKKKAPTPAFFTLEDQAKYFKKYSSVETPRYNDEKNDEPLKRSPSRHPPAKLATPQKVNDQLKYFSGRKSASVAPQDPSIATSIEDKLRNVDWSKVHETADATDLTSNKKDAVENFAKEIIQITLKKIEEILKDDDSDQLFLSKDDDAQGTGMLFHDNKDIDQLTDTLTGTILKATLGELKLSKGGIELPVDSQNRLCPPLGTPVLANGTLLALVVYTCDDIQPWVPWKYVNVRQNIDWIRERIQGTAPQPTENNLQPIDNEKWTNGRRVANTFRRPTFAPRWKDQNLGNFENNFVKKKRMGDLSKPSSLDVTNAMEEYMKYDPVLHNLRMLTPNVIDQVIDSEIRRLKTVN